MLTFYDEPSFKTDSVWLGLEMPQKGGWHGLSLFVRKGSQSCLLGGVKSITTNFDGDSTVKCFYRIVLAKLKNLPHHAKRRAEWEEVKKLFPYVDVFFEPTEEIAISDLAKHLKVTPQTIRTWEKKGLIPVAERTLGNHRRYDFEEVLKAVEKRKLFTDSEGWETRANHLADALGGIEREREDLAMLVRSLIWTLNKYSPDHSMTWKAKDYLTRHNLQGSPLRSEDDAEPKIP